MLSVQILRVDILRVNTNVPASVAQLDARPTGDQELGNILS